MRSPTTKAASSLQWRTGARDRDWVVREIAARVDREGPRPVSEDHKPGLVHPDVDWLINYLASISKRVALATSSLGTFQIGFIDEMIRAIFGRSYAAEPQVLIEQLRQDEAHRGRHAALDRSQPIGCCLQRAYDRSDSDPRRSRPGVALTKPLSILT